MNGYMNEWITFLPTCPLMVQTIYNHTIIDVFMKDSVFVKYCRKWSNSGNICWISIQDVLSLLAVLKVVKFKMCCILYRSVEDSKGLVWRLVHIKPAKTFSSIEAQDFPDRLKDFESESFCLKDWGECQASGLSSCSRVFVSVSYWWQCLPARQPSLCTSAKLNIYSEAVGLIFSTGYWILFFIKHI